MKENSKTDFLMATVAAGIPVGKYEKAILFVESQPLTSKFSRAKFNDDLRQQSFCFFSSLFLESFNFLQKSLGLRIGLKMLSYWFNKLVDDLSNSGLQVIRVEESLSEVLF